MATSNFQLLGLSLGGSDGGIQQSSADGAVTGLTCHELIVTDNAVFTKISGVDRDGTVVNLLTLKNLTGITVKTTALIAAKHISQGGYITDVTMSSGQIFRYTMPDTKRS